MNEVPESSLGGGSLEALRRANRLRVVDALRREGSASRSDLMRITGLSRTTITTLLGDLQERGMVVESEVRRPRGGRGRPAMLLRLGRRPARRWGSTSATATCGSRSPTCPRRCSPSAAWTSTSTPPPSARSTPPPSMVREVLEEAGVPIGQVIGAGMGLPGPDRPAHRRWSAPR